MTLRDVLCRVVARASLRRVGLLDRARILRLLRNWDRLCETGKTCGEEFCDQVMLLAVGERVLPETALSDPAGIDWEKLIAFIMTYLPVILEIIRAILVLFGDKTEV